VGMRVLSIFSLVVASAVAQWTTVRFTHYDDSMCTRVNSSQIRPVGTCIREERQGHFRILKCSDDGKTVTDGEYSDEGCTTEVFSFDILTDVCHEGRGLSVRVNCAKPAADDAEQLTRWKRDQEALRIKQEASDEVPPVFENSTAMGPCPGYCQDNSRTCAGGYRAGLCPGAANIQCCLTATPSCPGQCQQNNLPCAGNYVANLCPGGNDIQCCQSGGGCLERATVVARAVEKANGQYCECVCPHLSPWRCDCSGLTSYAWELAAPGLVTSTLPGVSTRLGSWAAMQPGDIILKPSVHVEVFRAWETAGSVFAYCGCHNTADGCSCRTQSTLSYWQTNGFYPAKGNKVC